MAVGLIDESDFQSKNDFQEKVAQMAASVRLAKAVTSEEELSANPDAETHWQITFETSERDSWLEALRRIDREATSRTRVYYTQVFKTWAESETIKRGFEMEDIQTQKMNVTRDFEKEIEEFELKREFQLQDTQTKIENALADYERKTADRLAFLHEQASIARKLGVAKNTIEAQTFRVQTGVVANVKTDTPFYLRGYEAIEKEIELIEGRKNTRPFTDSLLDLERTQRDLEQDRTLERVERNKVYLASLIDLQKKQRQIEQDKTLERAQALFNETPLVKAGEFTAAQILIEATEFKSNSRRSLILVVSLVAGGFIGIFVAALNLALQRRKTLETAGA